MTVGRILMCISAKEKRKKLCIHSDTRQLNIGTCDNDEDDECR